jgi:hypothetical protein
VEVFGEPWRGLGDADKAVLDRRCLRVHAHGLVAVRFVARDAMAAIGDQIWISWVPEALSSISTTLASSAVSWCPDG